jgi:hypothetical protein
MTLKIVGAGFGRTGTLSMKFALEQLGFMKCYHMMEVMNLGHAHYWQDVADGKPVDWDAVFEGFTATVDWPSCEVYRELAEYYPDSKVILTVRSPESWYRSCRNTIFNAMELDASNAPPAVQAQLRMTDTLIRQGRFQGKLDDAEYCMRKFVEHNEAVKRTIPPSRLLVYEVGSGWGPLCEFLGLPVPDTAYPSVNSTEDFKNQFGARFKPES